MRKLLVLLLLLCASRTARAEAWPPLDDYVRMCVAIVKAKTVAKSEHRVEFEVEEVWAGSTEDLVVNDRGRYVAYDGEHGVKVEVGQEIVFFFTRDNQPVRGKLSRHSTSFPIKDNRLIYGATSDDEYREYAVDEFREAILAIIAGASRTNP